MSCLVEVWAVRRLFFLVLNCHGIVVKHSSWKIKQKWALLLFNWPFNLAVLYVNVFLSVFFFIWNVFPEVVYFIFAADLWGSEDLKLTEITSVNCKSKIPNSVHTCVPVCVGVWVGADGGMVCNDLNYLIYWYISISNMHISQVWIHLVFNLSDFSKITGLSSNTTVIGTKESHI